MRARSPIASPIRQRGRAVVAIAFSLALLLCMLSVGYFFVGVSRPLGTPLGGEFPPPIEISGTEPLDPSAARVELDGEESTDGDGEAAETTRETAPPPPGAIRLAGAVRAAVGGPIEGASVVVLSTSRADDVRALLHDGLIFGEALDPRAVPDVKLRAPFESRVEATTDADGRFEAHAPGASGFLVIARATGFEVKLTEWSEGDAESIDVVLRPGAAIAGRVTDADTGEGIRGMRVVAFAPDANGAPALDIVDDAVPSARTQADGSYAVRGMSFGSYTVMPRSGSSDHIGISVKEARKVTLAAGIEPPTDVDFRVQLGGRVFGRVSLPDEEPAFDVKCTVFPKDIIAAASRGDFEFANLIQEKTTRTNAAGEYEIRGLPLDTEFTVGIDADEYPPTASDPWKLTRAMPELEVDLEIAESFSISGHVFYDTGEPADNVRVVTVVEYPSMFEGNPFMKGASRAGRTDAEGKFAIERLPRGTYDLRASSNLFEQFSFTNEKPDATVAIGDGGDVDGVTITISKSETEELAGLVRDDRGISVPEAEVRVSNSLDIAMVNAVAATTDEEGRFVAAKLRDGPYRVDVRKAGYATTELHSVTADAPLTITLLPNGRISGRVMTPEGAPPAPGGTVRVEPDREALTMEAYQRMLAMQLQVDSSTPIAPDGTYSVEAPPGKVRVHAIVAGFAPASSELVEVRVAEAVDDVDIRLTQGAILHGKVAAAGATSGLAGATVMVTPASEGSASDVMREILPELFQKGRSKATTNGEGLWEVAHLPPGKFTVTATHESYAPSAPHNVVVNGDEVREIPILTVVPGAVLAGRVSEKNKPLAGMMVQLMTVGAPLQTAMTDDRGRFEFENLQTSEYVVNVLDMKGMASGRMKFKSRVLQVELGREYDVDIQFGLGQRVHGRIKGLPKSPIPMQMIMLRKPQSRGLHEIDSFDMGAQIELLKGMGGQGLVLPDGSYEIFDVPPGKYILEIPRMPENPADLEAYRKMDRAPHYRREIEIGEVDREHNIEIR